jgi:glutamate mutase epsilon subunit
MSKSQPRDKPLLQDSEYNVIKQLEKEADFLYSAVEDYIRDAEKDNKPELVKLWNTIKVDEQNHLRMLRNELIKEIKQNEFR